jgi:hypothetical protein
MSGQQHPHHPQGPQQSQVQPQVTIFDSFKHKLPHIPDAKPPGYYRTTKASSDSTKDTDAPKALELEELKDLFQLGHDKLRNPVVPHSAKLDQYMPQLETTHILHTEADVLRAAGLYLLHPVNVAVASLVGNGHLTCTSETTVGEGGRTDIMWMCRASNSQEKKNIAVLELKNTKILRQADFKPAYYTGATREEARKKIASASKKINDTTLVDNAVWLSKQAIKYSRLASVPDVAIFDWHAMYVFNFDGMNEDADHPRFAKGAFFEENPNRPTTFRLLLLGFLVRALQRHHVIP